MKLLHTADLHLGRPLETRAPGTPLASLLSEAPHRSLENLVDHALDEGVDAVLFAGDSLDFRWCTPGVVERFNGQLSRLVEADIEVYLAGGDADPPGTVDVGPPLPGEVHRFPENETATFELDGDGATLRIAGRSHGESFEHGILQEVASELVTDDGVCVGVVHPGPGGEPDSPGDGSVVWPEDSSIDYWALGHRHRTLSADGDVQAAYPGSPQGRRPRESELGGCLLVTLEEGTPPGLEFLPTSPLVWRRRRIDLNQLEARPPETLDELADLLVQRADELRGRSPEELASRKQEETGIPCRTPRTPPEGYVVRWEIHGRSPLHERLSEEDPEEVLAEQLRREYRGGEPFLWTESVRVHTASDRPGLDELARRNRVFAEFADLIEEYEEESLLSDLEEYCGRVWEVTEDPESCEESQVPLGNRRLRELLDQAVERVTDRMVRGRNDDVD